MFDYFQEFRKFAAVFGREGHPKRQPTIVCKPDKIRTF